MPVEATAGNEKESESGQKDRKEEGRWKGIEKEPCLI